MIYYADTTKFPGVTFAALQGGLMGNMPYVIGLRPSIRVSSESPPNRLRHTLPLHLTGQTFTLGAVVIFISPETGPLDVTPDRSSLMTCRLSITRGSNAQNARFSLDSNRTFPARHWFSSIMGKNGFGIGHW